MHLAERLAPGQLSTCHCCSCPPCCLVWGKFLGHFLLWALKKPSGGVVAAWNFHSHRGYQTGVICFPKKWEQVVEVDSYRVWTVLRAMEP